ncbi:unnamed protein product [Amoebophrya sp. A120]|nr:unnamed protein product [Amoebophrya sp. A120]|eukprot:GSA120T00000840001.1
MSMLEVVGSWTLTLILGAAKLEFLLTVSFLSVGFLALLTGLVLPTRLVFLPQEFISDDVPEEDEDDEVDQAQGTGAALVGGKTEAGTTSSTRAPAQLLQDDDHLLAGEQRQPEAAPTRKKGTSSCTEYWALPWDFYYMGTLASVTQQQGSAEGRIFSTCLVINEVCVLLSRYTIVLYDRQCIHWDEWEVLRRESLGLAFLGTEGFGNLVLRVVWLIAPALLLLITAAVPSATFDHKEDQKQKDRHDVGISPQDAVSPDTAVVGQRQRADSSKFRAPKIAKPTPFSLHAIASLLHDKNTRNSMVLLNRASFVAVALMLGFETRQLVWTDRIDIGAVLFGSGGEQDMSDEDFVYRLTHGRFGECFIGKEHMVALQFFRWIHFPRVLCLVLAWALSLIFVVSVLLLQHSNRSTSLAGRRADASAGGRLVPKSASLLLPRTVYTSQVLAMLAVFSLPMLSIFGALSHASGDLSSWFHNSTAIVGDFVHWVNGAVVHWTPSCGTYADFLRPFALYPNGTTPTCDDTTAMWWEMPHEQSFNYTVWWGRPDVVHFLSKNAKNAVWLWKGGFCVSWLRLRVNTNI